jgi:hypothetical protein
MNILLLVDGTPSDDASGGNLTILGMLQAMCLKENIVTLLNVQKLKTSMYSYRSGKSGPSLELTREIDVTSSSTIKFWAKFVGDVPGFAFQEFVSELHTNEMFELVLTYHWNGAAALPKLPGVVCISLLGDPLHTPYELQIERRSDPFSRVKLALIKFQLKRIMRMCIKNSTHVGAFAHGHKLDYEKILGQSCHYLQTPMNTSPRNPSRLRKYQASFDSLQFVHLGATTGTLTRNSLRWLNDHIFDPVNRNPLFSRIDWLFIGRNYSQFVNEFPNILNSPNTRFVDHLEDLDELTGQNSILVVASKIELGIRTRILTAFLLGIPVLSDSSSKFGIPELQDFHNYFEYETVNQFWEKVGTICENPKLLNQVASQAQFDLDQYFSLDNFYQGIQKISKNS